MKSILTIFLVLWASLAFAQERVEVRETYTEDGLTKTRLLGVVYFQNNQENGLFSAYDTNGMLYIRGAVRNGARIGTWKFYKDGVLVETIDYNQGGLVPPQNY